MNQAQGVTGRVGGDIARRQGPVGLQFGDGVLGGGRARHFGRGHGGGQGGGAHQKGAAGVDHDQAPEFETEGGGGIYFRVIVCSTDPAAGKRARSQEAGPILPTALLEKAKGSVGMPKGLVFIRPSAFRSWKARTA